MKRSASTSFCLLSCLCCALGRVEMTAVVQNHHGSEAAKQSSKSSHFANWIIPEVIEEKRKRSDGRIVSNRYAIGKLLGKVRTTTTPVPPSSPNCTLSMTQGGFAKVFVGTLLSSKHDYALKIVSKASLAKDRARLKVSAVQRLYCTSTDPPQCTAAKRDQDTQSA